MRPSTFALALCLAALAPPVLAQDAQTYLYDANGRLISAITARPTTGAASSYTLDDADNRVARTAVSSSAPTTAGTIGSGQTLVATQLTTAGSYSLVLQPDGDLVVLNGSTVVQHSCTATGRSMFVQMRTNGELTILEPGFTALWKRPAASPVAGSTLVLSNTGVLSIKSGATTVWSSSVTGGGCIS